MQEIFVDKLFEHPKRACALCRLRLRAAEGDVVVVPKRDLDALITQLQALRDQLSRIINEVEATPTDAENAN